MSWNKNTINLSFVDATVKVLRNLEIPYSLSPRWYARGYGVNDGDDKEYPLHRLQYNKIVILERMERTTDCDTDDVITSTQFNLEEEPKDWKYEITEENS